MTELLCNVFRTVIATTPGDLLPVVYLVANKVAPAHEGVELGIGEATLVKALAEATGRKEAQIKLDMKVAWSPSAVRFLLLEFVPLRLLADISIQRRTFCAPPPSTMESLSVNLFVFSSLCWRLPVQKHCQVVFECFLSYGSPCASALKRPLL